MTAVQHSGVGISINLQLEVEGVLGGFMLGNRSKLFLQGVVEQAFGASSGEGCSTDRLKERARQ